MIQIQQFFKTIQDSIYNPKFYAGIVKQPISKAFKYFFLLTLFLTIVHVLSLSPILFNQVPNQARQLEQQIVTGYPEELKVQIHKGQVTTNVAEPYFIALPSQTASSSSSLDHLVVIDTKTPFSLDQFRQYKAYVWLTKDSAAYYAPDNAGEIRVFELAKIDNLNIDKNYVKSLASKLDPWINWLGLGLLVVISLGIYLVYSFRLIQLLILAALIFVLGKILITKLTYKQAYTVSLYAITLGLILELIMDLVSSFSGGVPNLPFMVTLITLGVVFFNFRTNSSS